jgi:hypothetical protein
MSTITVPLNATQNLEGDAGRPTSTTGVPVESPGASKDAKVPPGFQIVKVRKPDGTIVKVKRPIPSATPMVVKDVSTQGTTAKKTEITATTTVKPAQVAVAPPAMASNGKPAVALPGMGKSAPTMAAEPTSTPKTQSPAAVGPEKKEVLAPATAPTAEVAHKTVKPKADPTKSGIANAISSVVDKSTVPVIPAGTAKPASVPTQSIPAPKNPSPAASVKPASVPAQSILAPKNPSPAATAKPELIPTQSIPAPKKPSPAIAVEPESVPTQSIPAPKKPSSAAVAKPTSALTQPITPPAATATTQASTDRASPSTSFSTPPRAPARAVGLPAAAPATATARPEMPAKAKWYEEPGKGIAHTGVGKVATVLDNTASNVETIGNAIDRIGKVLSGNSAALANTEPVSVKVAATAPNTAQGSQKPGILSTGHVSKGFKTPTNAYANDTQAAPAEEAYREAPIDGQTATGTLAVTQRAGSTAAPSGGNQYTLPTTTATATTAASSLRAAAHPATAHPTTAHPATAQPATAHPTTAHTTTAHPAAVHSAAVHPAATQPAAHINAQVAPSQLVSGDVLESYPSNHPGAGRYALTHTNYNRGGICNKAEGHDWSEPGEMAASGEEVYDEFVEGDEIVDDDDYSEAGDDVTGQTSQDTSPQGHATDQSRDITNDSDSYDDVEKYDPEKDEIVDDDEEVVDYDPENDVIIGEDDNEDLDDDSSAQKDAGVEAHPDGDGDEDEKGTHLTIANNGSDGENDSATPSEAGAEPQPEHEHSNIRRDVQHSAVPKDGEGVEDEDRDEDGDGDGNNGDDDGNNGGGDDDDGNCEDGDYGGDGDNDSDSGDNRHDGPRIANEDEDDD